MIMLITHLQLHPSNSKFIDRCLGRYEVFYDFDYIPQDAQSRYGWCPPGPIASIYGAFCYFSTFSFAAMSCNLCEMFFLGRAIYAIKAQTESVASMLSRNTLGRRRR
jgi:hypothetical protein